MTASGGHDGYRDGVSSGHVRLSAPGPLSRPAGYSLGSAGRGQPGAERLHSLHLAGVRRTAGSRGRRVLQSALVGLGALLLLLGFGVAAYAQWAEWQHTQQRPPVPTEALPERLAAGVSPAPGGSVGEGIKARNSAAAGRPTSLRIPRINVSASVTAVTVKGGQYEVPAFDVGYHADSTRPGEQGNSVFNGHLETIDAGRVFAQLDRVRPGDAVYVYTDTHRQDWIVDQVRTVPNTDTSYIQPTTDTRLTLYTCAGTFDPRTRDYSHRVVVVGRLVQSAPRT